MGGYGSERAGILDYENAACNPIPSADSPMGAGHQSYDEKHADEGQRPEISQPRSKRGTSAGLGSTARQRPSPNGAKQKPRCVDTLDTPMIRFLREFRHS